MATGSEPTSKTPNSRTQLTSGLIYIAQISGIITVIVGTIYVLGLFALLLPILHKYDVSFDNAWYMVSLVPKTVIAGHGVKSLVWPALFTVIPLAFIAVMVLILMRIVSVGVRRAQHHASVVEKSKYVRGMQNSKDVRGMPLITAIYLVYGGVLGGVLLAIHKVVEGTNLPVPDPFVQFHIVAGALAYGILAVLCLLTLSHLTWRGGRYVLIRLIPSRNISYRSLRELGSLKLSLNLALYIGMVSVALSSVFLVDLFVTDELSAEPVFSAWIAALESLIVLAPAMLTLLLLNSVLSSELLDNLGTKLARIGALLKVLLSMVSFGSALGLIFLFFASLIVYILQSDSPLLRVLGFYEIGDLLILLSLFAMVLLLLPAGIAIPLKAFRGAGATIRFAFIAVTVVCTAVLSWSLVAFLHAVEQKESLQHQSLWLWLMISSLLFFVFLGAIVLILLAAQGVRYIARRKTIDTPTVVSTPSKSSGRSLLMRVKLSWTKLRQDNEVIAIAQYMAVLFGAFYLVLLITFLHGTYLMWPLIDNVNSISRSTSLLDEIYFYLTIVGGIASGMLLYKGLFPAKGGPTENDLSFTRDGLPFLQRFWMIERPRPRWKWVAWSITGAYAFSVVIGSLIAYLEEPPLPKVQVVEGGDVVRPDVSASTEEPGFHSSTKSLLAHTDGYWYLLNEDDGNLVVIPDQSNSIIKMPRYVDAVDERRSLKVEVPSEWVEYFSDYPPAWSEESAPMFARAQASRLTVATNVDNWGKDYVTPGAFIEAYTDEEWYKSWGRPIDDITTNLASIDAVEEYRPYCGAPDYGPAVYDLEDVERLYAAKIVRWRSCDEGGGYLAILVAVPKNRSFVVTALVQFPKDKETAYDAETDRILRSIEVNSNLLP